MVCVCFCSLLPGKHYSNPLEAKICFVSFITGLLTVFYCKQTSKVEQDQTLKAVTNAPTKRLVIHLRIKTHKTEFEFQQNLSRCRAISVSRTNGR